MPNSYEGGRFYAFLHQVERADPEERAWLLRLEALEARWFDDWLAKARDTYPDLPGYVERYLEHAYAGTGPNLDFLPPDVRALLFGLHAAFAEASVRDPAPVALLEMLVPDRLLPLDDVREGDWYQVVLGGGEPLDAERNPREEGEALLARLGPIPAEDPPVTVHRTEGIGLLARLAERPVSPSMLRALHHPHVAPDQEDGGRGRALAVIRPDGAIDLLTGCSLLAPGEPEWWETESCRARALATYAIYHPAGLRWSSGGTDGDVVSGGTATRGGGGSTGSLTAGGGGGPPGAGLSHGAPLSTPSPPPPASAAPPAYARVVGAHDVGAATCLSVWDERGALAAYVDFGAPSRTNLGTWDQHPLPCVCSDPVMVLSHWDYDHFSMVRWVPRALRLRWIVPEQGFGSVAMREVYARILAEAPHGGSIHVWRGAGGYLETGWGVLTRAAGATANDGGLVAYVRVHPDAAEPRSSALPPAFGPRRAPAASPFPPGTSVLNNTAQPQIVAGRLPGEWAGPGVPNALRGRIVVPVGAAPEFGAAPPWTKPGAQHSLAASVAGRWIPPQRMPPGSPTGGLGGWALQPEDFVRSGGVMLDFPPTDADPAYAGCVVVSPTPGSGWRPGPVPPHRAYVLVPAAGIPAKSGTWTPAWGSGLGECWAVPLSAVAGLTFVGLAGAAPLHVPATTRTSLAERYVLLPGDAGFPHFHPPRCDPPARAPRFCLAGLVAAHHGARTWFPKPLGSERRRLRIPRIPRRAASGQVVYTYGVRPGGEHVYGLDAKGTGHPHPDAVHAYENRGWGARVPGGPVFTRLNTAARDYDSSQAHNPLQLTGVSGPPHAYAQGHRSGQVALGWDAATGGPLRLDAIPPASACPAHGAGLDPPLRRRCACGTDWDFFV